MNHLLLRMAKIVKDETGLEILKVESGNVYVSKSRRYKTVIAKACMANILYKHFGGIIIEIARTMGFHHATIIHHLQAHRHRYASEQAYADMYDALSAGMREVEPFVIDLDDTLKLIKGI